MFLLPAKIATTRKGSKKTSELNSTVVVRIYAEKVTMTNARTVSKLLEKHIRTALLGLGLELVFVVQAVGNSAYINEPVRAVYLP